MFFPVCKKVIEQKYSVECARPPFNATIKKLKMKKWSSQWTQFMQLRKEAWKNSGLHRGLNPWPRWLPVRCSTNWAMKPLTLGAGQLWVHMFPWKKWVLMIYEINHIWTAEMKWKWRRKKKLFRSLQFWVGFRNQVKQSILICPFWNFYKELSASKEVSTYRIRKLIARIVTDCDWGA